MAGVVLAIGGWPLYLL